MFKVIQCDGNCGIILGFIEAQSLSDAKTKARKIYPQYQILIVLEA